MSFKESPQENEVKSIISRVGILKIVMYYTATGLKLAREFVISLTNILKCFVCKGSIMRSFRKI